MRMKVYNIIKERKKERIRMEKFYKVVGKPNKEEIEKFDSDNGVFYRFQNPNRELTSESKSWGMIYESEEEAEEDGYEALPGKSCCSTFEEVLSYTSSFDEDYVLLVFDGVDTGVDGDDGEYVAEYVRPVAVWDFEDVREYANKNNLW